MDTADLAGWDAVRGVVAPVDLGDPDVSGVALGLGATRDPTRVHVVHAVAAPMGADGPAALADARARLRALLAEHGLDPAIRTHVAHGKVADVVADVVTATGADLVVVPSHGRTGVRRLVLGSSAEAILRKVGCAVLVTRPSSLRR